VGAFVGAVVGAFVGGVGAAVGDLVALVPRHHVTTKTRHISKVFRGICCSPQSSIIASNTFVSRAAKQGRGEKNLISKFTLRSDFDFREPSFVIKYTC
jgi:hypothetical protein